MARHYKTSWKKSPRSRPGRQARPPHGREIPAPIAAGKLALPEPVGNRPVTSVAAWTHAIPVSLRLEGVNKTLEGC